MCGSISDWSTLIAQTYQFLKPGGWIEFQEFEAWLFSEDESIENAQATMQWQQYLDEASTKFGKRLNVATEIAGFVSDAGFTNVEEKLFKVKPTYHSVLLLLILQRSQSDLGPSLRRKGYWGTINLQTCLTEWSLSLWLCLHVFCSRVMKRCKSFWRRYGRS